MTMQAQEMQKAPTPAWLWSAGVAAFVAVWWLVYGQLIPASEWVVAQLPVDRASHTGDALAFFL